MGPISIDDPAFRQTIENWLQESSDLFVEVYYPHSGGNGRLFLVRTIQDFEKLVSEARSNAVIFVLRNLQFPIRGMVDDSLIAQAIDTVGLTEAYDIVSPVFFPVELQYLEESGSATRAQYLQDLENLRGKIIFTGKSAIMPESYSEPNPDENSLVARKSKDIV